MILKHFSRPATVRLKTVTSEAMVLGFVGRRIGPVPMKQSNVSIWDIGLVIHGDSSPPACRCSLLLRVASASGDGACPQVGK